MPRFAFEARTASGDSVSGVEFAADEQELDRRLADTDLLLIKARALRSGGRRGTSSRALVDFCYHLSVVIEAGIPLLQGLADLRDQGEGPLTDAVAEVAQELVVDPIDRELDRRQALRRLLDTAAGGGR